MIEVNKLFFFFVLPVFSAIEYHTSNKSLFCILQHFLISCVVREFSSLKKFKGHNLQLLRTIFNSAVFTCSVTLFGKTRLNENIVVPFFHLNAFFNIENALGNIFIAF